MRHLRLAAIVFALAVPCVSFAASKGNVLVPRDDTSPPAAPASPAPPDAGEDSGKAILPVLDPFENSARPAPKITPMPGMEGDATRATIPSKLTPPASEIMKMTPTQVLHLLSADEESLPPSLGLPYNFNVEIADKYTWGPQDTRLINRDLGIPADQVAKFCHLSIAGMVQTDTGPYAFDTGPIRPAATARYDGKLSGINITARAMCDKVNLPPYSGLILQVGDKYSIYLGQTVCPPPPANLQTLVYTYAGNGKGACIYR
ncbi:MAG: hypothetical protein AB7H77_04380 [Bdellovibrionales bacterium]